MDFEKFTGIVDWAKLRVRQHDVKQDVLQKDDVRVLLWDVRTHLTNSTETAIQGSRHHTGSMRWSRAKDNAGMLWATSWRSLLAPPPVTAAKAPGQVKRPR